MKKLFRTTLWLAAMGLVLTACGKEKTPVDENVTVEIKSLVIVNGGLAGAENYNGVIDADASTITFNDVAAETNLQEVKFRASLSLGAKLSTETYDFLANNDADSKSLLGEITAYYEGTTRIEKTYQLIVNLKAPEKEPVLDRIIMKDADGNENRAIIYDEEKLVLLGINTSTATLGEIVLSPARASYTFTTMSEDGVLSQDNPGKLVLDFYGLKTEYTLSFAASPTLGADFTKAVVHDFTVRTNRYMDYESAKVRGGDFNGKYVLVVNRDEPKVFSLSDLLADNTNSPIKLSLAGVDGGTFAFSAARFAGDHIYACNLAMLSDGQNLKIYHYADVNSAPEVVLDWDGDMGEGADKVSQRYGDNISVNVDASGNGYIFFANQDRSHGNGSVVLRFTVTNFKTVDNPTLVPLPKECLYYGQYNQVGANEYLFTSAYVSFMWLLDAEGNVLVETEFDTTEQDARPNHGCDPHIVTFNRGRYLLMTVAPTNTMNWNFGPVLYLFDITEGNDNTSALVKFNESMAEETFEPTYQYSYFEDPSSEFVKTSAPAAQANAYEVDGKLYIYTAACDGGFAIIEVPKAD